MALTVEDKFGIQERLYAHFYEMDARDPDAVAKFYTEDGEIVEPERVTKGWDGIKAKVLEGKAAHPLDHHWLGNMIITGDGNEAHAKSYVLVADGPRAEDDSYGVAITGIQEYDLVRVDDVWFIKRLVVQRAGIPDHVRETWKKRVQAEEEMKAQS